MTWDTTDKSAAVNVANDLWNLIEPTDSGSLLAKYFDPCGEFSGAWFDRLEDAHGPHVIGCHDLVAVTMLGVNVPGLLARDLLTNPGFGKQVSDFLGSIGRQTDLWDEGAGKDLDRADLLWDLLRERAHQLGVGLGDTKTSKLLAPKRPRLVPVTDDVVRTTVPLPRGADYWRVYRAALSQDGRIIKRLKALRQALPDAQHVSLLRILDAVVWMRGSQSGAAQAARG